MTTGPINRAILSGHVSSVFAVASGATIMRSCLVNPEQCLRSR